MAKSLHTIIFVFISFLCLANQSDTLLIKKHLIEITKTEKARNYQNLVSLNAAAKYIYNEFMQYADSTYYQTDDNASGTVGLLELARMLKEEQLRYRIELVAYTLEEPPFFRSEFMGSYIHAKSLKESHKDVYGMVCLEMIGYFDNRENTQDYPLGF